MSATSSLTRAPIDLFAVAWRNRTLVLRMTQRDIQGRYRGSMAGLLWAVLVPLIMLAVYAFVFGEIFRAKWDNGAASHTQFAIVLFAGLSVYGLFSECVTRAPGLIVQQPNFVKKVIFPLEIMPWISLGTGLFHLVISTLILLVFIIFDQHELAWTVVLFPLTVLPLGLIVLGLSWFLAALGVYWRDVTQIASLVVSALMFLSPVFYSIRSLPSELANLLAWSPLAVVIEAGRDVLIWGRVPDFGLLLAYTLFGYACATAGFIFFQKIRHGFADVV